MDVKADEVTTPVLRVLCVDDEELMEKLVTAKFRHKVLAGSIAFNFARSVQQARSILAEHPEINVIMSDINLGVESGIDLLREVVQSGREDVAVVMATAYGDMENIRRCMNLGAFDFIQKPFDFFDLEQTLFNAFDHVRRVRQSAAEHDRLADIERELDLARSLQLSLLPPAIGQLETLDSLRVFARFAASGAVGGDFFDYFAVDDDSYVVAIGDVSGSGIVGAMWMGICNALLRAQGLANRRFDPAEVMLTLNSVLCGRNKSSFFISLFLGVLNTKTGELQYCNAGHCLPRVLRAKGGVDTLPQKGGMVLGVSLEAGFENSVADVGPGDKLVLFTDGITEAKRPSDEEEFGDSRLDGLLGELGRADLSAIGDGLVAAVRSHLNHPGGSDDMTVVLVENYRAG